MQHRSVYDFLLDNAKQWGDKTAALVKRRGVYEPVTWAQLLQQSQQVSRCLVHVGVQPGDRVCILSQTRLEWITADMGVLGAGGVTVPIYPSNLPDECQYIIDNAGAVVVLAEDASQVEKLRAEKPRLPGLKCVVQMTGPVQDTSDGWVVGLDALKEESKHVASSVLEERAASLTKESILTIIYTSGTTGRPKGVVTTHDGMLYEAEAISSIGLVRESDVQLLFLPLAHSFAKVLEIAWLSQHHVMAFAENLQTIKENLKEVRPTLMAGVPRIFEKFYGAVLQKGMAAGGLKGWMFQQALRLSERALEAEQGKTALTAAEMFQYGLFKRLVLRKVGHALGETLGGRMRLMVSGGAPLSPKIAAFFKDVGFEVLEGFGLTETSAASTVNRPGRNRIGTVGQPLPGTQVKLASDGEVLIQGRGLMREYWRNPQATAEVLKDGWFYTGDIGVIDPDGSLRIVDRKKDIIVTAGGKNVAPQNIENLLKTHKLISQAVVHGDKRHFLSALITLDPEALNALAQERGLGQGSYADLTQRPEVLKEVEHAVSGFNQQLASYETIKKFKVLEHDFSQESGELTPSLKIKRKAINERYGKVFDQFYQESSRA